jgi:hypothetical protein
VNGGGRSARLRGGALSGGPSALGQGRARKQREPRLKLGKRNRDMLGGGGRFRIAWWPVRPARRRQMGRASFGSGTGIKAGTGGRNAAAPRFRSAGRARKPAAGLRTAAPRFRSAGRAHKPAAGLRTAAPRFRRPSARWRRAGRRLGFGGSRGAGPGLRPRAWRRRLSRLGKGGWR